MFSYFKYLKKQLLLKSILQAFRSKPDRGLAAKVTIVIGLLVVPFILIGEPFYAITLGLGVLVGALSETDDHPSGRIKSMILKVMSFAISSLAVELLHGHEVWLGIGLSVSTMIYILIGGISERFRGISFGALLTGIYTMIGAEISPNWYIQPVLLTGGALFYGLISMVILYLRPWRLLEVQLAKGFMALSKYFAEKAKLFPSNNEMQKEIRAHLSLMNVQTVSAFDNFKEVLNSYADVLKTDLPLKPFLHYFMVLQSLHERAASSHERYDLLSSNPENSELLEGIGQTLNQLAVATNYFAHSLLMGSHYIHPVSIDWMINALNDQLTKQRISNMHPLRLLVNNLFRSNLLLKNINTIEQSELIPKLEKDNRSPFQRLSDQFSYYHPRMRYALRLSIAFAIGFTISEYFNMAKGEWIILTILFVLQPSYSETRRRLVQRTLGTITGVVAGIILIHLLTPAGQLVFMLVSAYIFMLWMKQNYSIAVIFITTFVLLAFNLMANKGVAMMTPRLIDTLIGAALAYLTVRLLWPDWQSKHLPHLLKDALSKNIAYFKLILNEYQHPALGDNLNYRIARREAHRADNALVTAWQNIQLEPRKQQLFRKQAFTLTYLNHALLSYISAFGAHREQQLYHSDVLQYAEDIFYVLNEANKQYLLVDNKSTKNSEEILIEISKKIETNSLDNTDQQFIILANIAEVSGQMLKQAKTVQLN